MGKGNGKKKKKKKKKKKALFSPGTVTVSKQNESMRNNNAKERKKIKQPTTG